MLRVLVADDHAVVRRGVKQILGEEFPELVLGEAESADTLLDRLGQDNWDVVLLDVSMPGASGLDVLPELRTRSPQSSVLMLSVHLEPQYVIRAMKLGAAGYITKDSAPEELVQAIKKALSGGKHVSPTLAAGLASYLATSTEQPLHATLSEREHQVLCLIASGKTLKEIAHLLSLSVKTVGTYRSRVLEKMNMTTNAELTYYAVRNGLVN